MTATPPRADLRTLAAEGDAPMTDRVAPSPQSLCDHPVYVYRMRPGELLTIPLCQICGAVGWDDLREQVAEHRRMVLTEVGKALERARQARIRADGHPIGSGWDDAEWVLDRLAAAAPPAGLSATVPAGNAPAVPEEADGQGAAESGFRLKRRTDAERADYLSQKLINIMAERARLARELYEANCELAVLKSKPLFSTRKVMQTLLGALGDPVDEQELILRIDDGLRLGDVAQRVVAALALTAPHQHECACNRNWGGPCGPCVCEEPPRQGVWRLVCGAENIPPNQTYATKGAAEDVMRLHDGACPGTHGVEFVPDAGTDQTEGGHG